MEINLNSSEFDAEIKNIEIFNDGKGGVIDSVVGRIEKKVETNPTNYPDYRIYYIDSEGKEINRGFYYQNENDPSVAKEKAQERINIQGKELKHLLHAYYGKDYKFKPFTSAKEMLDVCMLELKKVISSVPIRIYVNYGTKSYPKNFLEINKFVPFVESMEILKEDSILEKAISSKTLLVRPESDANPFEETGSKDKINVNDWT